MGAGRAQAAPDDKTLPTNTYIPAAEKATPSGVATLDANAKILPAQLPDLSATILAEGGTVFASQSKLATNSITRRTEETKRQHAYARSLAKEAAGKPLPTSPSLVTVNGDQAARIQWPARWNYSTPLPLVIQFKGTDAGGDKFYEASLPNAASELGVAIATANFHGNSYGSPSALADARALYEYALTKAPISGVILHGTSMGGLGALNAVTMGVFPDALGIFLSDPVVDLRQRYDAGGGRDALIRTAYGIAPNSSDYAAKTAGYDPALRTAADFNGVPIFIVGSSNDNVVPLALHGQKLKDKLNGFSKATLLDTHVFGHSGGPSFPVPEFKLFLLEVTGGPLALPEQAVAQGKPVIFDLDPNALAFDNGADITTWSSERGSVPITISTRGTNYPKMSTAGPGGRKIATFDAAMGQSLSSALGVSMINQPVTYALITRIRAVGSQRILASPSTSHYHLIHTQVGDVGVRAAVSTTADAQSMIDNTVTLTNLWRVVIVAFDGSSSRLKSDSGAVVSGTTNMNTSDGVKLGANGVGSSYFTGDIARVLAISGAMSASDMTDWAAELAVEYGI
ncbi:hypothetical protein DBR22_03825 [Arthrobacter sp. HMWF013]|nr:hypothetical protein DBR22_03825 [Arthrobacter sp. HMWF013]